MVSIYLAGMGFTVSLLQKAPGTTLAEAGMRACQRFLNPGWSLPAGSDRAARVAECAGSAGASPGTSFLKVLADLVLDRSLER